MNLLTLDLGTKCGFASLREDVLNSGVVDFKPKKRESGGMRFVRFHSWLLEMIKMVKPEIVIYEMPHNRGGSATEILNTMAGIVQMECSKRDIDYSSVHSSSLKKFATGKGKSNKEDMLKKAREHYPDVDIIDDNHADALFMLDWAKEEFDR